MPIDHRSEIIAKFGDPNEIHNPLQIFFAFNGEARKFFHAYPREGGGYFRPEQVDRYVVHASVLDALALLKLDRTLSQKGRSGTVKNLWPSLANDVINFNTTCEKARRKQCPYPS